MTCAHPKNPAATADPCEGSAADLLANRIIDVLRIAIIATPIFFSLPQIARADPGAFSRLGLFSAVSGNVAERNGVIDETTPEPIRRMPVL